MSWDASLRNHNSSTHLRFAPAGDRALVVEFEAVISREVSARVRSFADAIVAHQWPEIVAVVPSYRALLVYYDCEIVSFDELVGRLESVSALPATTQQRRRWSIPVCYQGERAPDMGVLSEKLRLEPREIVRLHSSVEYMVYLIGFSPGFAYLGELPPELAIPRKETPSPEVPANSLQIGGQQTALSSVPMPSGWYIAGRTPLQLFDADRDPAFLLQSGDLLNFEPIGDERFLEITHQISKHRYKPDWEWVDEARS